MQTSKAVTHINAKVVIYDIWIENRNYRDEICNYLGLINNDLSLEYISDAGMGSSFDGRNVGILQDRKSLLNRYDKLNNIEKQIVESTLFFDDYIFTICKNYFVDTHSAVTTFRQSSKK